VVSCVPSQTAFMMFEKLVPLSVERERHIAGGARVGDEGAQRGRRVHLEVESVGDGRIRGSVPLEVAYAIS